MRHPLIITTLFACANPGESRHAWGGRGMNCELQRIHQTFRTDMHVPEVESLPYKGHYVPKYYTPWPQVPVCGLFKANVYTIWAHGSLA